MIRFILFCNNLFNLLSKSYKKIVQHNNSNFDFPICLCNQLRFLSRNTKGRYFWKYHFMPLSSHSHSNHAAKHAGIVINSLQSTIWFDRVCFWYSVDKNKMSKAINNDHDISTKTTHLRDFKQLICQTAGVWGISKHKVCAKRVGI